MASPNAAGTSGAKESSLTALISRLDRRNIPYFYKVMTKTAVTQNVFGPFAYALGFPVNFVRAHWGTNFNELVTFQPAGSNQAWPIQITLKDDPIQKHRVFAYGRGGWKTFVEYNDIQVGDTLVFSLVGFSRFIVDNIKAAPAEGHEKEDHSLDPSSFQKDIQEASLPFKFSRKVPVPQAGPQFVVNVELREVNQLGVPGKFYECFHDMLQSQDLQLKGPNRAAMMVEVEGSFYEQKMDINNLESGWKEFFVANNLRIGDLLEFSLVGPDC